MKKINNKGFSLVELIIVIAIMAVLIGVLAPQFIKYVERSRESTDLQNIEEIKTAVEAYTADSEGLTADVTVSMSGKQITLGGNSSDVSAILTYGIPAASQPAKSGKWNDFTWTYNHSAYTWAVNNSSAKADYFDYKGSAVAK